MKVLLIGASENPKRTSYNAIHLLESFDHETIAIGRKEATIGHTKVVTGFPAVEGIHTVTLYVNPTLQPQFYDYIISLRPKRVIFNPGTENKEFYDKLQEANIDYEEACTLVLLRTGQFE